jgi:hypothetical protein
VALTGIVAFEDRDWNARLLDLEDARGGMPMTQWLRGGSRDSKIALLTSWAAVLLMSTQAVPAMAQAADSKARLILSMKPLNEEELGMRDPSRRADAWFLRPNVPQELLTYVEIDEPAKKPSVTVQLLAGGVEVASQTLKAVEAKYTQVKWPRLDAAPNGAAPKRTEFLNPVELRLLVDGKPAGEAIKLQTYQPRAYLDAKFRPAEGENGNRLVVEVSPRETDPRFLALEPPCHVELIPNLARYYDPLSLGKRRIWSGNVLLEDKSESLLIAAEEVDFRPDARRSMVSLSADGVGRAFLFEVTAAEPGAAPRLNPTSRENILRINAPRFADPSKLVRMTFEADYVKAPADTKRLVLDVLALTDKEGNKHYSRLADFRGNRDMRWFLTGGGRQGGLQLQPDVKDWGQGVDLSGLHGKVTLRLRLLDEKNKSMDVLDTDKEEWKSTPDGVSRTITLDDTPPAVRFEKLPRPAVRTKPFVVEARGIDEESGIRDVVFFLGKIPGNAPVPPEAIARPGRQLKKDGPWTAELVVPSDARSPLDLSVRFTNNVGLYTTEVIPLEVADPPPAGVKVAKKGSIAGVVVEGERPQKGLKVDLVDAAGKVLLSTNTAADGTYVFKDLLPGDYRVSSAKTTSNTAGVSPRPPLPPLALAEGEDKTGVVIKLWRRPSAAR